MKRLMLALSGLSLALWAGCAADGVEAFGIGTDTHRLAALMRGA